MSISIKAPKGTKDVIPSDIHKWHYIENTLKDVSEMYGFSEIRFPIFEHTELFVRSIGDTTDVVSKEMYTFEKSGRSLTLRPEGTASTVRAFLENSLHMQTMPFKAYYIAPNFRYEKPQAGRLREHHQFGVECFGAPLPSCDAEIIALAYTFLNKLGITNIDAHLNSIGCPKCRPCYTDALRAYFELHSDCLCPLCKDRLKRNPMRILDCKDETCKSVSKHAPLSIDYLCDECSDHFSSVKSYLSYVNIPFSIDTSIVRGLDYYTKTVFEFVSGDIGAQSTICGGGRYDRLVSELGGPEICGMGFGCGLERLILTMESLNIQFPKSPLCDIYIASLGNDADKVSRKIIYELRLLGVHAQGDLVGRSVKSQMKYADKIGARFTGVIGDEELSSNSLNIKNMCSKEQYKVQLDASEITKVVK